MYDIFEDVEQFLVRRYAMPGVSKCSTFVAIKRMGGTFVLNQDLYVKMFEDPSHDVCGSYVYEETANTATRHRRYSGGGGVLVLCFSSDG